MADRPARHGLVVRCASPAAALARAKGYPYKRPASSFVFVNGAAFTFDCQAWTPPSSWPPGSLAPLLSLRVTSPSGHTSSLEGVLSEQGVATSDLGSLTPILAIGSNAAPEQLARKFAPEDFPGGVVVPVVQAVLAEFDVAYAPLISSYGSATATLEHSPGTAVSIFVTYLTPRLQQRMHETEGAYDLLRLEGVQLFEGLSLEQFRLGVQPVATHACALNYTHQAGTLHLPLTNPGSSPIALAEIQAAGRAFPALTQVQMQAALHTALADVAGSPGSKQQAQLRMVPHGRGQPAAELAPAELDAWISSNLQQPALRAARVQALTAAARPIGWARSTLLLTLGDVLSSSVK